jgi:flagella basal body P-ring formation protein FlgA
MMQLLCAILACTAQLWATCIRVEGEVIRASDFPQSPELHLPGEEILLRAPAVGARRVVESSELRRLLRLPEGAPSPAAVCFEQVTDILTPQRILDAMQNSLAGRTVAIQITDYSRYPVPKGRLEFVRTGLLTTATVPAQAVLWRGRIVSSGGRSTPVWARVVIDATRATLTCRRTLDPGMRIAPADLLVVTKVASPFDEARALQPEDAAGKTVKRRAAAGTEITAAMLAEPFDIEPRQAVNLEVSADAVHLKMTAIAEGRGRIGEPIWLKQTTTGKRIRARITGPQTAILEINPTSGDNENNEQERYTGSDADTAGHNQNGRRLETKVPPRTLPD